MEWEIPKEVAFGKDVRDGAYFAWIGKNKMGLYLLAKKTQWNKLKKSR